MRSFYYIYYTEPQAHFDQESADSWDQEKLPRFVWLQAKESFSRVFIIKLLQEIQFVTPNGVAILNMERSTCEMSCLHRPP